MMINTKSLVNSFIWPNQIWPVIIDEKPRMHPKEESRRNISHQSYSKPTSHDSKQQILDRQNVKLCPKSCFDILEIHFPNTKFWKISNFWVKNFLKIQIPFKGKTIYFVSFLNTLLGVYFLIGETGTISQFQSRKFRLSLL